MSHFEAREEHVEVVFAIEIRKFISDQKVDEDDICIRSNSVNRTALINRSNWGQILSGSVSHYFLCCCIVFCSGISISIRHSSGVMSCLVVVALGVEREMPNSISDPLVIILKVLAS